MIVMLLINIAVNFTIFLRTLWLEGTKAIKKKMKKWCKEKEVEKKKEVDGVVEVLEKKKEEKKINVKVVKRMIEKVGVKRKKIKEEKKRPELP